MGLRFTIHRTDNQTMAGQPTKYKPEYCDRIVEIMSEGHSVAGFARELKVARCTIYQWAKDHPEFADALRVATDASLAWWEDRQRNASVGEIPANASVMNFAMRNRFKRDYADNNNVVISGGDSPLEVDHNHTVEFIVPEGYEAPSEGI